MRTATDTPRKPARVGLRTKIIGLLSGVILVFSVAFIAYTYFQQRDRAESEMLEQSRMLVTEMDAVWDFVSVNQYTINHTSEGDYDFKSLHCAIAGKAVAVLFTRSSDYAIRFTNLNPRNIYNMPDAYETEALRGFYADPGSGDEVYGYATDEEGKSVFRYVRTMVYKQDCMECHGSPAGEIDVTGYPKEGAHVGDIAGAVSVIMPTDVYLANMRGAVLSNAALFVLLMAGVAFVIYHVLSRLVTTPLTELNASLAGLADRAESRQGGDVEPGRLSAGNPRGPVPDGPGSAVTGLGACIASVGGRPTSLAVPACAPLSSAGEDAPSLRPAARYASREVDSLFMQFNDMSRRLSELYGSLESQVVERTEQLRATNAELERQRRHVEEVNARLQRENQYKSDFLAIVSHELRTPLTSILAFTELLSQGLDPSQIDALRQVEEVEKNGAILLEMVNNVLETARIQAGSERLNLELIDLTDIVGMVESSNESVALKRGVRLSSRVGADVPLIVSDWEKVRRILMNLVSNAIKFTPEGGSVEIRVAYEGLPRQVCIDVEDTGIGIPADKQQLVFERFTQENMSTVRRYGGSGLGLSLVKDLVAMLGGTVSLVSAPGEGSTFTVRLPEGGPAQGATPDGGTEPRG